MANGVSNIHETGQPDTPVEVLTDILGRATQERDVTKLRALVEQASKLVSGLDPYLEAISTPASPVSCYMSPDVAEHRSQDKRNSLVGMPILLHTEVVSRLLACTSLQVCQQLIRDSLQHDWKAAHKQVRPWYFIGRPTVETCCRHTAKLAVLQGKTKFLQKRECCAGALEGRLIATLCRLTAAKSVLEVGMFTGTTTLAIAEAIPADGKV